MALDDVSAGEQGSGIRAWFLALQGATFGDRPLGSGGAGAGALTRNSSHWGRTPLITKATTIRPFSKSSAARHLSRACRGIATCAFPSARSSEKRPDLTGDLEILPGL